MKKRFDLCDFSEGNRYILLYSASMVLLETTRCILEIQETMFFPRYMQKPVIDSII